MLPLARVCCERLLAVGDPMQLPPTLHSRGSSISGAGGATAAAAAAAATAPKIDLSLTLFERLAHVGVAPVMLHRQYRCHPRISALASRLFYRSQLSDGLGSAAASARAPLLPGLPTIGFAEVRGSEQIDSSGSIFNTAEASRVVRIIGSLHAAGVDASRIGLVCMYRRQAIVCSQMLSETSGLIEAGVTVSTVDAFQGAERDVIVVSPSRTARDAQLGHLASPRRLNVTLTRARHHVLIVGCAAALLTEPLWATLISEAAPIPACFTSGASSGIEPRDELGVSAGALADNHATGDIGGAAPGVGVGDGDGNGDGDDGGEVGSEWYDACGDTADGRDDGGDGEADGGSHGNLGTDGWRDKGRSHRIHAPPHAASGGALPHGASCSSELEDEHSPLCSEAGADVGTTGHGVEGYSVPPASTNAGAATGAVDSSAGEGALDGMAEDDLTRLLMARQRKLAEVEAMKQRVHMEMSAKMDVGGA